MIAAPAAPFINLHIPALEDFGSKVPVDGFEPEGHEFHPPCQRGAGQRDAVPGAQDRFLPVERKVVAVFGHGDAGQQARGGDAAFLRLRGKRGNDRRGFIVLTGDIFGPDDDAAVILGGIAIEHLCALFANAAPLGGFGGNLLGLDDLFDGGQMSGNALAGFAFGPWLGGECGLPVIREEEGGLVFSRLFGFLGQREHQLELARVELFARGPEHPAQNEIHLLAQEAVFMVQALVLGHELGLPFLQAAELLKGDVFAGFFHSK